MRKQLTRALILASVAAACAAAARAQGRPGPVAPAAEYGDKAWKEFVLAEGGFSVNVVAPPQLSKQQLETAIGKIDNYLYVSQTATAGYMIAYADFPAYSDDPGFLAAVMDGARDNVLAADKSRKLLSEKEIKVEGHGGREWLVEDGEMLYRAKTFMVKKRFYQVLLLAPLNVAFGPRRPSADAKDFTALYQEVSRRFFGSFKLLPEGGPTAAAPGRALGRTPEHATGEFRAEVER